MGRRTILNTLLLMSISSCVQAGNFGNDLQELTTAVQDKFGFLNNSVGQYPGRQKIDNQIQEKIAEFQKNYPIQQVHELPKIKNQLTISCTEIHKKLAWVQAKKNYIERIGDITPLGLVSGGLVVLYKGIKRFQEITGPSRLQTLIAESFIPSVIVAQVLVGSCFLYWGMINSYNAQITEFQEKEELLSRRSELFN